jgi:hypothetical protein
MLLLLLATRLAAEDAYCPWWPAVERWGVRAKEIQFSDSFRRRGIEFTVDPESRRIAQLSTPGWKLRLNLDLERPSKLFAGDFDNNGREDYLIVSDTGGVGLTPPTWVQFVMIDRTGRPVPWKRGGYADPSHLRFSDFNSDGRLEWTDTRYGPSNRDQHHYWTSALYEARDAYWHPVIGQHGSVSSPQFVQFTNTPNRRPFPLTETEKPPVDNLGSAPSFPHPLTILNWLPIPPAQERDYPLKGLADYMFHAIGRESQRVKLSNNETCSLAPGTETILDSPQTISWIEPTKKTLANHPLDLTVTRHKGECRIERIVVHAP